MFVVAPASANTIAKLAAGICDSLLTTAFLACTAPRIVAPAMNDRMWEAMRRPRRTSRLLRERGVEVLEPGEGALASRGETGAGGCRSRAEIMAALEAALGGVALGGAGGSAGDLAGVRVLVTAGGTREAIDPVRFIGNRSSGRMGVALAEAAASRGRGGLADRGERGPADRRPASRASDVVSAAELAAAAGVAFEACGHPDHGRRRRRLPAGLAARKGRSSARDRAGCSWISKPTEDVLAGLAVPRAETDQLLVGFAAEHGGEFVDRARGKLERKGIDAIVVNDVSDAAIGFETDDNEVTVVTPGGETPITRGSKRDVADAILDRPCSTGARRDRSSSFLHSLT